MDINVYFYSYLLQYVIRVFSLEIMVFQMIMQSYITIILIPLGI